MAASLIKKRPTVLVVDDVEINREILEEILKDNYEVASAGNGQEGLDYLYNAKVLPKIILLDITMPVMNGYEMLNELKVH